MRVAFDDVAALADATPIDLGASEYRRVTQDDIDRFADLTGDRQWIHIDRERAACGPTGGTVAQGYLTLGLIGSLWPELFHVDGADAVINYGLDRVRFTAPVRDGTRIRLRAAITEVTRTTQGCRLRAEHIIEIEDSKRPALVAVALYDIRALKGTE